MGSKKLKAISVRGSIDIEFHNPEELYNYCQELNDKFMRTKWGKSLSKWGSTSMYSHISTSGYLRNKNLKSNKMEKAEAIDIEHIHEYQTGKSSCFGCGVCCRHRYYYGAKPYGPFKAEGPEFTTQLYLGHLLNCADFDHILVANHLTNKLGIDQMETGNIIAGTIDLLENGLIDKTMLNGLDLKWGDSQAILKMIEMIAKREGFGNVLADGAKGIINRFGRISENYFLNIKGMGTLATDDRFIPSFSLGIATSTRGADHLRSRPALDLYGLPEEVLEKIYGGYVSSDSSSHKGKSRMIWWHEILYSIVDSLGICKFQTIFIGVNAPKFEEYSRLIEFATGFSLSKDDLMNIGERTYTLERMFNNREGFTRKDDDLPKRYYDEKIPDGYTPKGKIISREDFERLLDEYYQIHGWDNQGIPKKDTLQKLGLEKEPTHIL